MDHLGKKFAKIILNFLSKRSDPYPVQLFQIRIGPDQTRQDPDPTGQDSSGSRIHNSAILPRSVLANPQYVDQIPVWMTHLGGGILTTKNYLPRI